MDLIRFRPVDVQASPSKAWIYGLFEFEHGSNNTIGRIYGPGWDKPHRFSYMTGKIEIIGPIEKLANNANVLTLIDDTLAKLELPNIEQLRKLIPDELDLNNELTDVDMQSLLSYSDLRKFAIKQQIFTNYIRTLFNHSYQDGNTKESIGEINDIGDVDNSKKDIKQTKGQRRSPIEELGAALSSTGTVVNEGEIQSIWQAVATEAHAKFADYRNTGVMFTDVFEPTDMPTPKSTDI